MDALLIRSVPSTFPFATTILYCAADSQFWKASVKVCSWPGLRVNCFGPKIGSMSAQAGRPTMSMSEDKRQNIMDQKDIMHTRCTFIFHYLKLKGHRDTVVETRDRGYSDLVATSLP